MFDEYEEGNSKGRGRGSRDMEAPDPANPMPEGNEWIFWIANIAFSAVAQKALYVFGYGVHTYVAI